LATETGLSLANASQHLQTLREAGLVESRKAGLFVHYRLADPAVFELCRSLRVVGERRLADLDRLVRQHFTSREQMESVTMTELLARANEGSVVIVDARPAHEYEAGHIAGAVSVPIDELKERLRELPKNREVVAYCRGPYCVYADEAVQVLRAARRRAQRLEGGFPEWKAAGFPVESGAQGGAP
jgi:rhodanese-related sulfurtransferase